MAAEKPFTVCSQIGAFFPMGSEPLRGEGSSTQSITDYTAEHETVKDRPLIGSQKWSRICINSSGKRWGGERRVVTTTKSANLIMSDHMGSTINNPRPVINQQVPGRTIE